MPPSGRKGVRRDDSDDELGAEDLQWEWMSQEEGDIRSIRGARHGSGFQCLLGDCVLLKAEGDRQAWVGIVCEFLPDEEDGEKMANFMWFSTEKEIRNQDRKRVDFLPNELYITPAWDVNSLNTINGSARIYSLEKFNSEFTSGRVPKGEVDKTFICRRACNTRTASYSDEFTWEELFRGREDIENLIDFVKSQTKTIRRKKRRTDNEEWIHFDNETIDLTPQPKKRSKVPLSPSQLELHSRISSKPSTPISKRIVVKRPLEFTPLGTRLLTTSSSDTSPFQLARNRLHVSAIPSALPCREELFATVYTHLEAAISDGSGSCIYVSGTPGTGKTATVREVVSQLHSSVQADELDDFIFVEINGMKVTEPYQSYTLLWEALRGDRVSPSHAMELLEREFSQPNPRRVPCVVLMDELDQLVTKNQSVMYNFFNWPGLRHSRLIVLAVANTMDLPERTLSNKISSRLGLTRVTFPGYTYEQLMTIIKSRLQGVPGNVVECDAIQFASRKIAAVSGDARRALDICRRAVEIAEMEVLDKSLLETPSRNQNNSRYIPDGTKSLGRVTITTIKQAIAEATSSPLQQYLKMLPLASKLLLAALLLIVRRSGVAECLFGEVIDQAKHLSEWSEGIDFRDFLLEPTQLWPTLRDSRSNKANISTKMSRAAAIGGSAAQLAESGLIAIDFRKAERSARVKLLVSDEELKLAFKDDLDMQTLGFA